MGRQTKERGEVPCERCQIRDDKVLSVSFIVLKVHFSLYLYYTFFHSCCMFCVVFFVACCVTFCFVISIVVASSEYSTYYYDYYCFILNLQANLLKKTPPPTIIIHFVQTKKYEELKSLFNVCPIVLWIVCV